MDNVSGLKGLWTSRRFMALLFDTVISLAVYFLAKYAAPAFVEDAKFVIAAIQPIFGILIAAFTVTDVVADRANVQAYEAELFQIRYAGLEKEDSVGAPAAEDQGSG